MIKSLYITQCILKNREVDMNLYFQNKEEDYDIMFILQRIIGATANKQIYNIIDTSHFVKDREKYSIKENEKTLDKKNII